MNSLSRSPEIIGAPRPNKNLEMFLKPNKEGEFYRVRLLAFNSKDGRRVDPHVTRIIHSSWETDPTTGKKHLVKVVCPTKTPWIEVDGNKKTACKVCSYVNQQWAMYNESGKTDKNASMNASKLRSSYEAIVPVYVVNDPNYDKNNGKCKVIIFDDKERYLAFRKKIEAQLRVNKVFNGEQAVDCLLYVGTEDIPRANGTTFSKTVITNVKFSTKPKDLPAITSKLIDSFPFDETYFTETSPRSFALLLMMTFQKMMIFQYISLLQSLSQKWKFLQILIRNRMMMLTMMLMICLVKALILMKMT